MVTLPIDLALSAAIGSTAAIASRSTAGEYSLLRSPALWALIAFELLVFVPVGAYLLWRFPAWSLMYVVEPSSLPMPPAYLTILYPVVAVGTYVGCRRLLTVGKLLAVLGVLAGGVLLAAAIGFYGREQIEVIGSACPEHFAPDHARGWDEAVVERALECQPETPFESLANLGLRVGRRIDFRSTACTHVERCKYRCRDRVERRAKIPCDSKRHRRRGPGDDASISKIRVVLDSGIEDIRRLGGELNDGTLICANAIKPVANLGPTLFSEEAEEQLRRLIQKLDLDAERLIQPAQRRDDRSEDRERRPARA